MSFDVDIVDSNGEVINIEVKHNITGGTYALGGTTELSLNITYNYSKFYYIHLDKEKGLRFLNDKSVKETLPILLQTIVKLKEEEPNFKYISANSIDGPILEDSYWAPTIQNARKALEGLVHLALLANSEGFWRVD